MNKKQKKAVKNHIILTDLVAGQYEKVLEKKKRPVIRGHKKK